LVVVLVAVAVAVAVELSLYPTGLQQSPILELYLFLKVLVE
jgi:hypothetical protein